MRRLRASKEAIKKEIREHRSSFFVYIFLRTLVLITMVLQIFNQNYENAFLCILTLFLMIIPSFIQVEFKIELPSTLEIIILLFIFSAEIWEFFEFGMDTFAGLDMQKDTIINHITSVTLDPTKTNIPITIDGIKEVIINGKALGVGGYIDIGLIDTMYDLFVNFIGAIVFSFFGYFYVVNRGKGNFVNRFIPRLKDRDHH